MDDHKTSRILNREILLLIVLAVGTFGVFLLTREIAAREQTLEQRIASDWYQQGNEDIGAGRRDRAIQSFRRAASEAKGNRQYDLALANALTSAGQDEEARQILLQWRERDPEDTQINTYLARIASRRGQILDAMHFYQNALYGRWNGSQADQDRYQLRVELIQYLLRNRRPKLAISELLILETQLPGSVSARIQTAELFLEAGDSQNALSNYTDALRLDHHNAKASFGAGKIYFRSGDYEKAHQYLASSVEADSSSQDVDGLLELTQLVLADDPLTPDVSREQQRSRLESDLQISVDRLDSCMGQMPTNSSPQLQSLKAEALGMQSKLSPPKRMPDTDTIKATMELIVRLQNSIPASCGQPSVADSAVLLSVTHAGVHK